MGDFDLNSTFIPALYKPADLLPIAKYQREILYLVETFPVLVIVGQTGSGKTTQIPQFLEKAGCCSGGKRIGITQVSLLALCLKKKVRTESLTMKIAPAGSSYYYSHEGGRRSRL